jgi:hypothetical protein
MKLKKIKEVVALADKHFSDQCWLCNAKRQLDEMVEMGLSDDDEAFLSEYSLPGVEICGVCGCGRSEDVQRLYRMALRAIKDRSERISGKSALGVMEECFKELTVAMETFCNDPANVPNPTTFKFCDNALLEEVVLHVLYNLGYTEHGTSVHGSWLTEKGEAALAALDMQFEVVKGDLCHSMN